MLITHHLHDAGAATMSPAASSSSAALISAIRLIPAHHPPSRDGHDGRGRMGRACGVRREGASAPRPPPRGAHPQEREARREGSRAGSRDAADVMLRGGAVAPECTGRLSAVPGARGRREGRCGEVFRSCADRVLRGRRASVRGGSPARWPRTRSGARRRRQRCAPGAPGSEAWTVARERAVGSGRGRSAAGPRGAAVSGARPPGGARAGSLARRASSRREEGSAISG